MKYRRLNITLPIEQAEALDKVLKSYSLTRSGFIRESIALKMHIDSFVKNEYESSDSNFKLVRLAHFRNVIQAGLKSDSK